jgi:hypothetical protein
LNGIIGVTTQLGSARAETLQEAKEIAAWKKSHNPDIIEGITVSYKVRFSNGKEILVTEKNVSILPIYGSTGSYKQKYRPDYIYIDAASGTGQFSDEEIVNSAKDTIQEWNYRSPRRGGEVFGGDLE